MLAGSPSGQRCQTFRHLVMHSLNVAVRKGAGQTALASEWLLCAPHFALVVETVGWTELSKVRRITVLRKRAI